MFDQFNDLLGGVSTYDMLGANNPAYAELAKTIVAGSGPGQDSTGGRAVIYEDMEGTLFSTTFGEKQFAKTLWRILKERAAEATSTMHEFARIQGYGETGAFSPEVSDTLNPIDADLARGHVQVRFLRTKRRYAKSLQFTRNMVNPRAIQALAGTRFLISNLERAFYVGDSAMVPDEFDGILKTATANNRVQNMAGAKVAKTDLTNGAMNIVTANGVPSHLFIPVQVQNNLDQTLQGNADRIVLAQPGMQMAGTPIGYDGAGFGGVENAILMGATAAGLRTSYGNIMFNPHIFTDLRSTPFMLQGVEVATNPNAPATPTGVGAVAAAGTGFNGSGTGGALTSGVYSGAYAGTYQYRVSAENSAGESVPCAAVSATVTAAQQVTLTWNRMAGATCYRIYRSRCGAPASDCQFIVRVADPGAGGTANYVDVNQKIAGCYRCYMLDLDSPGEMSTVGWAQLAPMMLDNLPPGDTYFQFIQFIFGALAFYAPAKMWVYDNVGIY